MQDGDATFDLQAHLDGAFRLYTLMIEEQNSSDLRIIPKLRNRSIRQLLFLSRFSI